MLLLRGATLYAILTDIARKFQYMLLLRGATKDGHLKTLEAEFQYMLLLRGATPDRPRYRRGCWSFNTCSSCEEQPGGSRSRDFRSCFNTCSSCEEQPLHVLKRHIRTEFQYMLLLRGATRVRQNKGVDDGFNTCSSCEEQRWARSGQVEIIAFQYMLLLRGATRPGKRGSANRSVSIHAPLARSNPEAFVQS